MSLPFKEVVRGSKPGSHYIRYQHQPMFRYLTDGHLVARPELLKPTTPVERALAGLRRLCVGDPLPTERAIHERLTKVKGLAVLSSDALSSVAYATEEIMLILILAGAGALGLALPLAAAIVGLLSIVGASYRQTIKAYPNGGGSYIVASDNLGTLPGLVAAASLLVDYVLTVAVSVSAGVAALTSAFQVLDPYTVPLGAAFIVLIMLGNLRGIRESGNIFALPTYVFLFSMFALIAAGLWKVAAGVAPHPVETVRPLESLGVFLILRAFASGCVALTGVEAISNGVPAFKPPEAPNARATLTWMVAILAVTFAGTTILAHALNITPSGQETVVSQIAATVFGRGAMYYVIQFATMLILVLAANTSFADFPRLSSILARDGFMPHQFAHRGDRLAFSYGIVVLAALSVLLLVAFGGETSALIPLYAVGVFTAFTLSQSGMVVHHTRVKEPGWRTARIINGIGAMLTGLVTVIIAATKFMYGAWIVLLLIPLLIWLMLSVKRHYRYVDRITSRPVNIPARIAPNRIIVPVAKLDAVSQRTLAYARTIAPAGEDVVAVHVSLGVEQSSLVEHWKDWSEQARLVCIESPYRSLIRPLLAYIDMVRREVGNGIVTVVLPEFVPARWYEHILHNHAALRLKAALLFRPNTVVASVPYWPEVQD